MSGKISNDDDAGALTGSEFVPLVKSGHNKRASADSVGGCFRGTVDPADDDDLDAVRAGSIYVNTDTQTAWIKIATGADGWLQLTIVPM